MLGTRALEKAVEALRSADQADPALSADDPENRRNAARVLANLALLYQDQGREAESSALLKEAYGWAPELFRPSEE